MQVSADRILTEHVGSLTRNSVLSDLLIRQARGEEVDNARLKAETRQAVVDVVRQQVDAGIDVVNNGEQPRVGFQTYMPRRMRRFDGVSNRETPLDHLEFPDFAEMAARRFPNRSKSRSAPKAITGAIKAYLQRHLR
ncbi:MULTISPECIES: hypothetical protein [Bradyrhizobium]|jgi:5-methyltetrahydropteroyltriglutamate--homocysteine methyltransferase|uniref:hypothetical protein n=1 Tax=Bradyrhizobium TaxID=374 RepID=UPI0012FDDC4F|nr:hypothetical protein [Bradyrhizobium elkanii]MCS3524503.1 methionine synthase II (cobalamin-independent) [Bradyrhizobium elkanii]MCS4072159.1 methionine synthase II (cobalamin-independent) [Bradyrhizobium elkanii]MCS4078792.1 methionine synthase II (cobalamin-independent) [Bradyrhizobium elkanii]MCW2122609.1 methionine synthase II (cobalamin-independent) [Bradyrhizobium elkanii]MCW2169356.1 methionine synthase II (cobalamin-independent) [Bradyrhizobium elkanii]